MTLAASIETALGAIAANAFRSALTMLGIVIGVASVIVMMAVGGGARSEIDRQISQLGTNVLVVTTSARKYGGRSSGPGTNLPLTETDLRAVATKVHGIAAISGQLWASTTVVHGNANTFVRIWGVHEGYLELRDWPLQSGRPIAREDLASARRVALLGRSAVGALFGDTDPLGASIRIRNVPFTIVGVLSAKGQNSTGEDHDWNIFVPMTAARLHILGRAGEQVGQISVKLEEGINLADAQQEIEQVLRQSRRVPPGDDDTFSVGNLTERIKARTAAQATLSWLLGATAAISLLVGGIGIMNIMLVSVTERTREIGLRKALGARPSDITRQFLMEAVVLCMLGGLSGVLAGVLGAHLVAQLAEWPVVIASDMVLAAIAAATVTGLAFGAVPAMRAGRLHPIEGLRSE